MTNMISLETEHYSDMYVSREPNGVLVPQFYNSVFVKGVEDPIASSEVTLTEALQKMVSMNTTKDNSVTEEQKKELLQYLYAIIDTVEKEIETVENLPIWKE